MYTKKPLRMAVTVLLVVISIFVVPSPAPLQANPCWTVMVYLDGDNNLESAAVDDLNEMEAIGSTAKVNVVVQFDRHAAYDNTNGNWTSCKRFYVTKDANGYDNVITSAELSDLGEINMGDPNELEAFVTWGKTNYPADHYLLVLWDHGTGWKTLADPVKAVCIDETDSDLLTIKELASALDTVTCSGGCPLDIVGFDACFMGMLEVDYEIMPYAHYRVGSEEYEPQDGWDYFRFLGYLKLNPYDSPAAVSREVVDSYMNFYGHTGLETMSAVHVNPTGTVVDRLDIFAVHLAGAMQYKAAIQEARSDVEFFSDLDYIDLYHYASLIYAYVPDRAIKKDALALKHAILQAVIAEGHGYMNGNAHGISIYFPFTSAGYSSNYETYVEFTQDTFWEEFLKQYYTTNYPLDAEIGALPETASSTELVTVTMGVTNMDDHSINGVAPSPLTVVSTGTAHAVLATGPVPVSANLVAGDSAAFMWTYQVFSGAMGGTLTFSGNAYGTDSISGETVFSPLVHSNAVVIPGPGQLVEDNSSDPNEQMQPVADNRIQSAERALDLLEQQFAAAEGEGKDITPCEELLELVEAYIQTAQENFERGNYIAANYWALQATAVLEEAEDCLKNL